MSRSSDSSKAYSRYDIHWNGGKASACSEGRDSYRRRTVQSLETMCGTVVQTL